MVKQRREHYRVNYPENLRPMILTDNQILSVIDISADGIKFKTGNAEEFTIGSLFSGHIKFYDDPELIDCKGQIIRQSNEIVTLFLEKPIPVERIKLENLFIAYKLQLLLMNNLNPRKQSI
jgi:hypothetical protein